jgi:hypothetical protein
MPRYVMARKPTLPFRKAFIEQDPTRPRDANFATGDSARVGANDWEISSGQAIGNNDVKEIGPPSVVENPASLPRPVRP